MGAANLKELVTAIGDELLERIAGGGPGRPAADGKADGQACADCRKQCVQSCPSRTQAVIAAGADRISAGEGVAGVDASIAGLIDHTLLKPEATGDDIRRLCAEARRYGFASVCVNPYWVCLAGRELAGSPVKVCAVAGFPLGATWASIKKAEAEAAIQAGAREIDMVMNIGALRSGELEVVEQEIRLVGEACHRRGALLKVILETALLEDRQKAVACVLAKMAGADFVKTSTGFGPSGATVRDVALMRLVVGPRMGVKAAGGIRTRQELERMVAAGATRIGASAGVRILEGAA